MAAEEAKAHARRMMGNPVVLFFDIPCASEEIVAEICRMPELVYWRCEKAYDPLRVRFRRLYASENRQANRVDHARLL